MIKWYISKWKSFFTKYQEQFDLSDENMNRATLRDYWVMFKMISSPVFMLLMLPLTIIFGPVIFVFQIFETAFAIIIIAAGVAFLISSYMILTGQSTIEIVLLCIGSGIVFLGYAIGYPMIRRKSKNK